MVSLVSSSSEADCHPASESGKIISYKIPEIYFQELVEIYPDVDDSFASQLLFNLKDFCYVFCTMFTEVQRRGLDENGEQITGGDSLILTFSFFLFTGVSIHTKKS